MGYASTAYTYYGVVLPMERLYAHNAENINAVTASADPPYVDDTNDTQWDFFESPLLGIVEGALATANAAHNVSLQVDSISPYNAYDGTPARRQDCEIILYPAECLQRAQIWGSHESASVVANSGRMAFTAGEKGAMHEVCLVLMGDEGEHMTQSAAVVTVLKCG
jgi:hypothetical protein